MFFQQKKNIYAQTALSALESDQEGEYNLLSN